MISIKRESDQAVEVRVTDTTGLVTDLSGADPVFEIWTVDDTTDLNVTQVIANQRAYVLSDLLTISCMVEPQYKLYPNGVPGWGIANSAPSLTLPFVVATGVNDKYNVVSIFFGNQIVPPGTYATYDAVATAMNLALGQFDQGYSYSYDLGDSFGLFSFDAAINRFRFDGNSSGAGVDSTYNGMTIANGSTHDMLAGTGWGNGQVFFDHAIANTNPFFPYPAQVQASPLANGRYRLYVSFESLHAQVPKIGPVELLIY